MDYIQRIIDMWEIKIVIGTIFAFFTPFKETLVILFVLIILDTITGVYYAIKIKKFKSVKLKKGVVKIITYFASIVVCRLLEVGLADIIETTAVTKFMVGFLIITESVSIMENLALLGAPIPASFIRNMVSKIKNKTFKNLVKEGMIKHEYTKDIEELITFQVPIIKTESLQKLFKIKLEEWGNVINVIDIQFSQSTINNNDLIFYRLSNLISVTRSTIHEKWIDAGISLECINAFNNWHKERTEKLMDSINEICYSNEPIDKKKKQIIEKIIIILYQTVIEIQKGEADLLSSNGCK